MDCLINYRITFFGGQYCVTYVCINLVYSIIIFQQFSYPKRWSWLIKYKELLVAKS